MNNASDLNRNPLASVSTAGIYRGALWIGKRGYRWRTVFTKAKTAMGVHASSLLSPASTAVPRTYGRQPEHKLMNDEKPGRGQSEGRARHSHLGSTRLRGPEAALDGDLGAVQHLALITQQEEDWVNDILGFSKPGLELDKVGGPGAAAPESRSHLCLGGCPRPRRFHGSVARKGRCAANCARGLKRRLLLPLAVSSCPLLCLAPIQAPWISTGLAW